MNGFELKTIASCLRPTAEERVMVVGEELRLPAGGTGCQVDFVGVMIEAAPQNKFTGRLCDPTSNTNVRIYY